jgi:hypothetical protein
MTQVAFLRYATAAPSEVFSFEAAARKLPPVDGLPAGHSALGTPNQAWLALDLHSLLAYLYEAGQAAGVRQILELPLQQCPEVLLLGLATARSDWPALARDVCDPLVARLAAGAPSSAAALPRLWAASREALLRGLVALYDRDAGSAVRALDVCQVGACLLASACNHMGMQGLMRACTRAAAGAGRAVPGAGRSALRPRPGAGRAGLAARQHQPGGLAAGADLRAQGPLHAGSCLVQSGAALFSPHSFLMHACMPRRRCSSSWTPSWRGRTARSGCRCRPRRRRCCCGC